VEPNNKALLDEKKKIEKRISEIEAYRKQVEERERAKALKEKTLQNAIKVCLLVHSRHYSCPSN
jgi:hypothetical protein